MTQLELRKRLLLAESELNRAELTQEWKAVSESFRGVAVQAKKYSSVALASAMVMAGLTYFWRAKTAPAGRKPSWWQLLLKGVKLGASLWTEFRPQPKPE